MKITADMSRLVSPPAGDTSISLSFTSDGGRAGKVRPHQAGGGGGGGGGGGLFGVISPGISGV